MLVSTSFVSPISPTALSLTYATNALLLLPNLDAAFDKGFITFKVNGSIMISKYLDHKCRNNLGITSKMRVKIQDRHQPYLKFHREEKFKKE